MANSFIYNMTDDWSNSSYDWVAIDMNVTDNGSTANSALINLSVDGANAFTVFKSGDAFISGGIAANNAYANRLVDGIMIDYTVGNGRIMLGGDDGLTVYAGNATHVTNTTVLMSLSNNGIMSLGNPTANVQLGANTVLGTPSVAVGYGNSNSSVNFVVTNSNTGGNTSADFTAYDSLGLTSANFVDMGINGNTWSGAFWTINGPSDGYLYTGNTNLSIGAAGASYVNFFTGGTLAANERMRIAANGHVGIGTTTPAEKFNINSGSAEYAIQWNSTGSNNWILAAATNRAYIGNKSTPSEVFTILNGGNIGIGNNTPAHKLSVSGNAAINGTQVGLGGITINTSNGTGSVLNSEAGIGTWKFNNSLSVSANTTAPESIYIKPDGLQLYLGTYSASSNTLWQYTMSSAWNTSTATYTRSALLAGPATGLWFKPDTGTKMYTISGTSSMIREYDLSTGWDISTATATANISAAAQDSAAEGLAFTANGSTMFVLGDTTDYVYQYTLSTPWSINTASYASKSLYVGAGSNWGLHLDSTATYVYITENTKRVVYQYTLGTPGDISTGTLTGQQIVGPNLGDNSPEHCWVETAQGKAYVVGDADNQIVQLNAAPGFIISNPAAITQLKGNLEVTGNVVIGGTRIWTTSNVVVNALTFLNANLAVAADTTVSGNFYVGSNTATNFRVLANNWTYFAAANTSGTNIDNLGNMTFNGYNPSSPAWKMDVVYSANTLNRGLRVWNFADQTNASSQIIVHAGLVAGRQSIYSIFSNTLATAVGTTSNTPHILVANNTTAITIASNTDVTVASNTLVLGTGGLTSAQAANGWSMLPNGMKANYGWVAANSSTANVTFTSPFAVACLHVFLTPVSATATGPYLIQPANTTVAPIRTTSATAANVAFFAIGY